MRTLGRRFERKIRSGGELFKTVAVEFFRLESDIGEDIYGCCVVKTTLVCVCGFFLNLL